ncbi:MAG TPA: leucyl/phenylalanyl-tRNA--protein transferase, partial [Candidatus Thioglobus sp.]|nr:leucyl/phenylalanyl-tRNA--protein transferase [Candidatus Thioglobus sp.]
MINIPEEFILHSPHIPFPDVELALDEPNGLIAIGGDLSTERLLSAYRQGIFPWYSEGEPVLWYSPNPRMVITKDTLHISKSLEKVLRSNRFEVRMNM